MNILCKVVKFGKSYWEYNLRPSGEIALNPTVFILSFFLYPVKAVITKSWNYAEPVLY